MHLKDHNWTMTSAIRHDLLLFFAMSYPTPDSLHMLTRCHCYRITAAITEGLSEASREGEENRLAR